MVKLVIKKRNIELEWFSTFILLPLILIWMVDSFINTSNLSSAITNFNRVMSSSAFLFTYFIHRLCNHDVSLEQMNTYRLLYVCNKLNLFSKITQIFLGWSADFLTTYNRLFYVYDNPIIGFMHIQ